MNSILVWLIIAAVLLILWLADIIWGSRTSVKKKPDGADISSVGSLVGHTLETGGGGKFPSILGGIFEHEPGCKALDYGPCTCQPPSHCGPKPEAKGLATDLAISDSYCNSHLGVASPGRSRITRTLMVSLKRKDFLKCSCLVCEKLRTVDNESSGKIQTAEGSRPVS